MKNGQCEDLDECKVVAAQKRNLCGTGTCINLVGAYRCDCPKGYVFKNGQCEDIDECSVSPSSVYAANCGHGAKCLNKPGGFDCICENGYELKDNKCLNIDECKFRYTCSYGKCVDTDGSYACDCPAGFIFDEKTKKCQVINECMQPDRCGGMQAGRCKKDGNRVRCECYYGYQNADNDLSNICQPINWCLQKKSACPPHSHCVNSASGAACECNSGYKRDDKGVCVNINECDQAGNVCHSNAQCTDTEGSYNCKCLHGFKGDGIAACKAVCQPGACQPDQTCVVTASNDAACSCSCTGPECLSIARVCGSDGVTYDSVRDFKETSCKQKLNLTVNYFDACKKSCADVTCPTYHFCSMKDGSPVCSCSECSDAHKNSGPVCSTKGFDYASECDLMQARCQNREHFEDVKYAGRCKTPIPCKVSSWSSWSSCSVSCGLGVSKRTRYISKPAQNDGHCQYSLEDSTECYLGPCPNSTCSKKACPSGSYCVEPTEKGGEAICNCQNNCPEAGEGDHVCGKLKDNSLVTFDSLCHMQRRECNDKQTITFLSRGKCGETNKADPVHCSVVVDYQKVTDMDQCTSVNPVRINRCSGGCGLRPNICCTPKRHKELQVQFSCGGGGTTLKSMKVIAECSCQLVDLKENEARPIGQ